MNPKILVTGMSAVTPYGTTLDSLRRGLSSGKPAIGALSEPDCSTWPVKVGGWVPDLAPNEMGLFHNKLRGMGKYVRIGVLAAQQALTSAGLKQGTFDPDRVGAFIASGTYGNNAEGLFRAFACSVGDDGELNLERLAQEGIDCVHPWWLLSTISNNLIFFVTHFLNLKGANTNCCNSAVAGAYAMDRAIESLRRGEVDVALVGGADCPVNWQLLSDLSTLGFLAEGPPEEVLPSKPFHPESLGAVMADGAAFLILEREDRANSRGASPWAEIRALELHASLAGDMHPSASGGEMIKILGPLLDLIPRGKTLALNTSAVGHPIWDNAEKVGIEKAMAGRSGWFYATKPWLGHSFSISFILETVVSLLGLKDRRGLAFQSSPPAIAGMFAGPPDDPSREWEINLGQCFGGNTAGVLLHVL